MLKKCKKRAFVFFVVFSFLVTNPHFNGFLVFETYAIPSQVSIKGTTVNVRSGPGTNYKLLGTVNLGYKLAPLEVLKDASGNGKTWYEFIYNDKVGYVRSDFCKEMLTYSYDAEFEAELNMKGFPESYKPGLRDLHANYPNWIFTYDRIGLDFDYAVDNEMIGTRALVTSGAISSMKSTDFGKYDYTTSKWPTFDGGAWVCASREAVRCYMDPRNFLYMPYVFQFETQTFNSNVHTIDGIREMLKGTFLDSKVETEGLSGTVAAVNNIIPTPDIPAPNTSFILPINENAVVIPVLMNDEKKVDAFTNTQGSIEVYGPGAGIVQNQGGKANIIGVNSEDAIYDSDTPTSFLYTYLPKGTYTYAELIYDACRQVNANPYVIISMILQEQGDKGTDSVSGNNKKFKSAYNYGNINAFAADGLTTIENGLKYALTPGSYGRPWNTKEKGIYGLCDFYANSYVKDGQDTFYLKKWNVQGVNMFKHQYMTNIAGAASEGQLLGNAYDDILLSMPHEFKIPVYENLPETNCPVPSKDGSPNNKLKSLSVNGFIITPTFNTDTNDYTLIVNQNTDSVFINAEAYDKKAAVGGIGHVPTVTSNTYAIIYCVAENGDIRQYNINIYKPGAEGITYQAQNEYMAPVIHQTYNDSNNYVSPDAISKNTNYTQFFNNINTDQIVIGVGPGQ